MYKRRRGYLKHYNDATSGDTIQRLLMNKKPYAVLLHWYILERCNQADSNQITITFSELKMRFFKRIDYLLENISELSRENQNLELTYYQDKLEIIVANYAEYQENRGQKSSKKPVKNSAIKDKRLKIKDKIEFFDFKNVDNSELIQIADCVIDEVINGFNGPEGIDYAGMGKTIYYLSKNVLNTNRQQFRTDGFKPELQRNKWRQKLISYWSSF